MFSASSKSSSPSIARSRFSLFLSAAWWLNLGALILLIAWLSVDGYLSRFAFELLPMIEGGVSLDGGMAINEGLTHSRSLPRQVFGSALISIGVGTFLAIGWGLLWGPIRFRTTRRFLLAAGLMTLWVFALTNWASIIEAGKGLRIVQEAEPLERFAQSTLEQWDALTDEKTSPDYSKWTSFNAYPVNKPRMLFFLGEQAIPNTNMKIRSIEFTPGEAIRFELASEQIGNWLELRLDDLPPQDFVGGLQAPFEAVQWRRLRNQLYLVRYR